MVFQEITLSDWIVHTLMVFQEMRSELAHLAHRCCDINKYRVETCCVIGLSILVFCFVILYTMAGHSALLDLINDANIHKLETEH